MKERISGAELWRLRLSYLLGSPFRLLIGKKPSLRQLEVAQQDLDDLNRKLSGRRYIRI